MALPDDGPSTAVHEDLWIPPADRFRTALEDFERGPIALSDPSEGIDFQVWHLTWNDDEESPGSGDFTLFPETTGVPVVVLNVPHVTQAGLAFDQNGHPFIAYMQDCAAFYWWFDPVPNDVVTVAMAADVTSVACALDDHRPRQIPQSDIILAYTRGGSLYYRQERERFSTERLLQSGIGASQIYRIGMNRIYRLQWEGDVGNSTRLSTIVGNLAARVEFPSQYLDVSELEDTTVRGLVSAGLYTSADTIRTLQQLYPFDFPQVDGKLSAIRRGGPVVKTILQDDLVADREFKFDSAREQGVEFPLKWRLGYASAETDYTPTTAQSERRSRDIKSQSETVIESPVNHTADEAAQIADVQHKVAWNEFEGRAKFSIPESFAELVPSDPINLEVRPGVFKRMRLTKMVYVDGASDCEAVIDRISSYTAGATIAGALIVPGETPAPTLPGATTWEFMDLPALLTSHDGLAPYIAGRGDTGTAWHGARVQRLVGADWEIFGDITTAEIMGLVEEAVGFAPPEFIDTTNTVLLSLNSAPPGYTTDLLLSSKGAWLLGDEIIQVRDWIAEGANWRGSYLFRGRLDTPAAAHSIGERAVFLGTPVRVPVDVSLRDTTLVLRAPSFGQMGADATQDNYPFIGRSAEEWPPEMLASSQNGNDWNFSWVPRYRLGNSANPIPSAHFYGWRLSFSVGSAIATHDTGSTSPTYTYTEAQQIIDFGSAQASFTAVEVRALNFLGGEGKALTEAVP